MSASILTATFVATALTLVDPTAPHLAIGDMTERVMAPYVWEMLGLCVADPETVTAATSCEWSDSSPHCQAQMARRLPCDRERYMNRIWLHYQSGD